MYRYDKGRVRASIEKYFLFGTAYQRRTGITSAGIPMFLLIRRERISMTAANVPE